MNTLEDDLAPEPGDPYLTSQMDLTHAAGGYPAQQLILLVQETTMQTDSPRALFANYFS
jgi:hypothetical protein